MKNSTFFWAFNDFSTFSTDLWNTGVMVHNILTAVIISSILSRKLLQNPFHLIYFLFAIRQNTFRPSPLLYQNKQLSKMQHIACIQAVPWGTLYSPNFPSARIWGSCSSSTRPRLPFAQIYKHRQRSSSPPTFKVYYCVS